MATRCLHVTKKGTLCRNGGGCSVHKDMQFHLPICNIPYNILSIIHAYLDAGHMHMLRMCGSYTKTLPKPSITHSRVYIRLESLLYTAEAALDCLQKIQGQFAPVSTVLHCSQALRVAHRKIMQLRHTPTVNNVGRQLMQRLKAYEDRRHTTLISFFTM